MRAAASLGTLCWLLLLAGVAAAQAPLEVSGLRGGRHVGSALEVEPAARIVVHTGYAFTEGVLADRDRHDRAFADVAAAYAPVRALQVALALSARYDAHHGDAGDDRGTALSAELTTRHAFALSRRLALGAQARLRFPAADSVRHGLRALTPELALLASASLPRGAEASLLTGYRFDRSLEAVGTPGRLSAADLLAASVSRYDAALLGALFALPLGPLVTSFEWSWDLAVGAGAPAAASSPMRLRLAVQLPFRTRYVAGVELGVSPSARPELASGARIEPRTWAALGLGVLLRKPVPAAPPALAPPPPAPEPFVAPEPALLDVRVVDATSAPLAGARVARAQADVEAASGEAAAAANAQATDKDGAATLTLPEGAATISVSLAQYQTRTLEVITRPGRTALTVTLTRDLPEGEIKGKVRSLRRGRALSARITVEPLNITLETDASGDFAIPVPPGEYTLEIEAPGHEPQRRTAKVEQLGVTILVVDLRRSPP